MTESYYNLLYRLIKVREIRRYIFNLVTEQNTNLPKSLMLINEEEYELCLQFESHPSYLEIKDRN